MTDQNHPITPPPELVQQWRKSGPADAAVNNAYEHHIATQAARWGADQELEACAKWLSMTCWSEPAKDIRAARRPKPLSLKEQALALVQGAGEPRLFNSDMQDIIRRALEALPE